MPESDDILHKRQISDHKEETEDDMKRLLTFVSVLMYLHVGCVKIRYNGGFLSDIIQLTPFYYHWGTRLNAMKIFCPYIQCSHLNVFQEKSERA